MNGYVEKVKERIAGLIDVGKRRRRGEGPDERRSA